MKKTKLFAAVLAIFLANSAQADSFNFSYSLFNSSIVTGSFDGTASGDVVTGVSNFTAAIDGVAMQGGWYGLSYDTTIGDWSHGTAQVSFSGNNNNFLFVNSNFPTDNSFTALIYNFSNPALVISGVFGVYNAPTNTSESDYFLNSRWSLSAVSAVPEPESVALFLAGLGLVGTVARRRKQKTTTV